VTAAPSAAALLATKALGISFGGLRAVDDFQIEIRTGEIVGLIGPNGAGKTTCFNMITGVYKPTTGEITLAGDRIDGRPTYQINRLGIARTFQNIRLFKQLSVLDNVRAALHGDVSYGLLGAVFRTPKYRATERRLRARAEELLTVFALGDRLLDQAGSLPYGEQRKLEIVRALATGPKLLLLDEPAAGMNPQETANLMRLIHRVRDEFGVTILLIEHDMSLVMKICERIYVLDYGRAIAQGTPAEIQANPKVVKAYLGED
jgi:branched-chain amino acid transport system ATP-binding protein